MRPDVDAGEALPDLRREITHELDHLGDLQRLVLARHLHGDVDAADRAVGGDEACRETRLGEGGGADPGAFGGVCADRLVHQIPHHQIVPVGGGVLEVGEGVDAGRVRRLPGALGEPGDGFERAGRGGVAIVRDDGEEDVVVPGVGVLQRLEREELRIVLAEEHAVVRREFEEPPAARGNRDQDQGGGDDRPPRRDDPLPEPCFDLAHRLHPSLRFRVGEWRRSPRFRRAESSGDRAGGRRLPAVSQARAA